MFILAPHRESPSNVEACQAPEFAEVVKAVQTRAIRAAVGGGMYNNQLYNS